MFTRTVLAIVATVATFALIIGMTTIPYTQTAAADKDCNIGQIAGKQPGWGGIVSDEAKAGGVGGIFAGANKMCHSD